MHTAVSSPLVAQANNLPCRADKICAWGYGCCCCHQANYSSSLYITPAHAATQEKSVTTKLVECDAALIGTDDCKYFTAPMAITCNCIFCQIKSSACGLNTKH
jgi:hypothetical protein